jgi:hypothetical protein
MIAVLSAVMTLLAHDVPIYEQMTELAARESYGLNDYLVNNLGFAYPNFRVAPVLPRFTAPLGVEFDLTGYTPVAWLKLGAKWEDMTLTDGREMRCLNHFYTQPSHSEQRKWLD